MAGRLDFECEIMSTVKSHIDAGQVKGLAILSKTRSPAEPNLPTALEQGLDAQAYTWNALFLPKGAPDAVVKKLNGAVVQSPALNVAESDQITIDGKPLPRREVSRSRWRCRSSVRCCTGSRFSRGCRRSSATTAPRRPISPAS